MKVEDIIEFLEDKPGYLREGRFRLHKILLKRGHITSIEDCAKALKVVNSKNSNSFQSKSPKAPEGFEVKSMWQGANGEMLYSYKATNSEEDSKVLEEATNKLREYHNSRDFISPETTNKEGKIKVHTIADLHIGALVSQLQNTKDYNVTIAAQRLTEIAEEINSQNNKENHIALLADFVESVSGLSHADSWKSMHNGAYGANVLILAYELVLGFLEKVDNLKGVYIVSGNHDRLTASNKEDREGDGAKLIAYFLKDKIPQVEFNQFTITKVIDNIEYIFTHGHHGFMKGDIADIILSYSSTQNFKVVVSGHLHTRNKKERHSYVQKDTSRYRAYVCPSVFTGNHYSEGEGYSSTAGFYTFSNKNGLPKVEDIPLS